VRMWDALGRMLFSAGNDSSSGLVVPSVFRIRKLTVFVIICSSYITGLVPFWRSLCRYVSVVLLSGMVYPVSLSHAVGGSHGRIKLCDKAGWAYPAAVSPGAGGAGTRCVMSYYLILSIC
jgi:hypothetical protein